MMSMEIDATTRLQLRWERGEGEEKWICNYELMLALDKNDIRREGENGEEARSAMVLSICKTRRCATREPCRADGGGYYFDAPFRDGAHANWDSKKLGNLPVVCIALDGTVIHPEEKPRP